MNSVLLCAVDAVEQILSHPQVHCMYCRWAIYSNEHINFAHLRYFRWPIDSSNLNGLTDFAPLVKKHLQASRIKISLKSFPSNYSSSAITFSRLEEDGELFHEV